MDGFIFVSAFRAAYYIKLFFIVIKNYNNYNLIYFIFKDIK